MKDHQHARTPARDLTEWQPIATAPEGKLVVVCWRDDDGNEMHDFDYFEDGAWMKWSEHYEWAYSVAPAGSHMPRERAPYTHWIGLPEAPAC